MQTLKKFKYNVHIKAKAKKNIDFFGTLFLGGSVDGSAGDR